MARKARTAEQAMIMDRRFEGSAFSLAECKFLIDHLGEPAIVALPDDAELPDGVNEAAVAPILQRTYELELYQEAQRTKYGLGEETKLWVGFDRLREILSDTLDWLATVKEYKRQTRHSPDGLRAAAIAPHLFLWDPDTDIPYLGGVGSDSDFLRHALGPDGVKIPLYSDLHSTGQGGLQSLAGVASFLRHKTTADQASALAENTPDELVYEVHAQYTVVKCPICHHGEEYETEKPSTKRAAMGKMKAHLSNPKTQKDAHRLLMKRVQSGKAGTRRNAEQLAEQRAAKAEGAPVTA